MFDSSTFDGAGNVKKSCSKFVWKHKWGLDYEKSDLHSFILLFNFLTTFCHYNGQFVQRCETHH